MQSKSDHMTLYSLYILKPNQTFTCACRSSMYDTVVSEYIPNQNQLLFSKRGFTVVTPECAEIKYKEEKEENAHASKELLKTANPFRGAPYRMLISTTKRIDFLQNSYCINILCYRHCVCCLCILILYN